MSEEFQQDESFVIEDLETLKMITDPFRLRILEAATRRPTTVKRIAGQLGVSPKKLYYHVNMMEEHGLLVVVDTQLVSGIVEKWYQARARHFTVDRALCVFAANGEDAFENLNRILTSAFELTRADILDAARLGLFEEEDEEGEDSGVMHILRGRLALRPGEREPFTESLQALLEQYRFDEVPDDDDYEFLGCTLVIYSMPRPAGEEDSDDLSGEEE